MAEAVINFTMEWREVSTTCDPCSGCNDIIYGKQYQLFMEPGGATDTKLCESCYQTIAEG